MPKGFEPWAPATTIPATATYAEWKSSGWYFFLLWIWQCMTFGIGAGYNASARNPGEHILTDAQAANYTVANVFLGTPSWIDLTYVP
jgi:hypothetical protein